MVNKPNLPSSLMQLIFVCFFPFMWWINGFFCSEITVEMCKFLNFCGCFHVAFLLFSHLLLFFSLKSFNFSISSSYITFSTFSCSKNFLHFAFSSMFLVLEVVLYIYCLLFDILPYFQSVKSRSINELLYIYIYIKHLINCQSYGLI